MPCNLCEALGIPIALIRRKQTARPEHLGAARPWGERMRKPTYCTNEREHPARFRVWMKNGAPESVLSTFNCFVQMIDWERRWRKFEDGDEPICVCEDAAREMGIVR